MMVGKGNHNPICGSVVDSVNWVAVGAASLEKIFTKYIVHNTLQNDFLNEATF